jgi:hypothetical protein
MLHWCGLSFSWTHSIWLLRSQFRKAKYSHKSHLWFFLFSWNIGFFKGLIQDQNIFCIDFCEHILCAFLGQCAGRLNTHTNCTCINSCLGEWFASVFLDDPQDKNFSHKCCTCVVWYFHEHIQCGFLDHCDWRLNTHTNHIWMAYCFHEPFEYDSLKFILGQNLCDIYCTGAVSFFHEYNQCA